MKRLSQIMIEIGFIIIIALVLYNVFPFVMEFLFKEIAKLVMD